MNVFLYKYFTIVLLNLKRLVALNNLGLLLPLFEFNEFSFLIDIIDNIINTSVSRDQNSHQWQCIIIVTWYDGYNDTALPLVEIIATWRFN